MSTHKSLAKSAGVISLGIAASRLLGFARDIIIAAVFGTSVPLQAFVVAFRIPNMLRDLVGEGAANAAFVPVLSSYAVKKTKEEFWGLAQALLNVMIVVLAAITALGMAFTPAIVALIAPGFIKDPEKFRITVELTRWMFPYIFLVGLTAYTTGILNSLKLFGASAFSQPLWNIVFIAAVLWLCPAMQVPVMGLAIGVLAGGVLQLLVQVPQLASRGLAFPRLDRYKHPGAAEVGRLLVPRVLGASIYQVNVFVNTILASLSSIVGEGAIAAIYYSNRLWMLPLAIFGTAFSQAMLPTMSEHAAREDIDKFKQTLSFSLRSVFFVTIPSSVGLIVLAGPIVRALFERGSFDSYSTGITASALLFYSIGLFAYAGVKILVSAFYSLKDTRTPVKTAAIALVINLVLNIALMFPLKVGGLALATSIASIANFFILFALLEKKIGPLGAGPVIDSFIRVSAASAAMAAVLMLLDVNLAMRPVAKIAVIIPAGMIAFFAACVVLRVEELKGAARWISRKK
ncbi:MAG: murein biosynthesis integral membrane protein MurJ [Candidatus Omnitrophota bacterium]